MTDRIIDRIKKMLALAGDSAASEGERENATRMAHNLLAKHNLSMASLESPSEKRQDSADTFYGRPWATGLAQSVGQLFFCFYFQSRTMSKNSVRHHFVGLESNAITSLEMARFLVESIRTESGRRMREGGHNTTWRRSFCVGAAQNLRNRIYDMKQESVGEPGTGLVLVSLYKTELTANEGFLADKGIELKMKASQASSKIQGSAYNQGKDFGSKLSLNRQIKGNKNETLLLG